MRDSYGTYDGSKPEPPYECPECSDLRAKLQAAEAKNAQLALAYATPCDPAFNNWIEEAEWLRGEVARLNTRVAQADKTIYDTNELEKLYDELNQDYCLVRDSRDELIKDYAEWMSPDDYVPLAQERDDLLDQVSQLRDQLNKPCPGCGL